MGGPPVRASLALQVLGLRVRVGCDDAAAANVLLANFGAMVASCVDGEADLRYRVERDETVSSYALTREDEEPQACADLGLLVYALEKDLTLELQRRRSELLFLHAAAVEWQGHAFLLAAESGSGKSTTAWALVHHGCRYLSDELGPVDLRAMAVLPFPHALCLKHEPPPPYVLPDRAIRLGRRIHVPTQVLPGATSAASRPLAAVFLLKYRAELEAPQLRAIGAGEASARLYATALNPLAHPGRGLDAVARIAEQVPCFTLASADLATTCALISATMGQTIRNRVGAA